MTPSRRCGHRCSAPFSRLPARQRCYPRVTFNEKLAPGARRPYLTGRQVRRAVTNMWGIIVRYVSRNNKQYSTVDDLKAAILEAWDQIDDNTTQNLVKKYVTKDFRSHPQR
ncbi:hypothetical protein ANCDUO_15920 [Ancylostoma duodenale]|uniref:Uncharacterized protein n=1 Tax=Ancylostoma duodenale TaxID=51022 RepID=A0A0C2CC94_9BILA|nr:hypothetical protein ANCDUO_15920 [Ancylostoma duodenale]